jgi:glutamyl-tRNA synthetase
LSKSNKKNNVFPQFFFDYARDLGTNGRLRIAPTPSGFLHLGNAVNFTLIWLVARLNGAKILLRIDDVDTQRKRPEYVLDIFESLSWLGLDWDEGPGLLDTVDPVKEFEAQWSQHHRLPMYAGYLEKLREQRCLFACQKSRTERSLLGETNRLVFRKQPFSLDDPQVAWRIFSEEHLELGDFVVRRRDGLPSYQLASFADDVYFRITHIVRGDDLVSSTAAQIFIATCLNQVSFLHIKFLHHPLLFDTNGNKLSKSAGSSALRALRTGGLTASMVMASVSKMLDLAPVETSAALLEEAKERLLNTAPNAQ